MSAPGENSQPIRVCFVQPIQSPYWSARLRTLAKCKDLEIILLLEAGAFAHRPGWRPEPIQGVTTEILGSSVVSAVREGGDGHYQIRGVRSIPWRLSLALSRIRPDIVVLSNATQLLLSLPAKCLSGLRLGLTVEDTPHSARALNAFQRVVKRWSYKQADYYFPFSEDSRDFLQRLGITSNVLRTSWSIDMVAFQPRPEEKADVRLGCVDGPKERIVLFVGALVPNKGILILLKCWCCLPSSVRARTRLRVAGMGPLEADIVQLVESRGLTEVELLGHVSYEMMPKLFREADLLVLPTLQDLFSLTVLEAMACGCPVITTPFNGARELVDDGKAGWIVDPTDPEALVSALNLALAPQTPLKEMRIAARARVERMDNVIVMEDFARMLRATIWGDAEKRTQEKSI